MINYIIIAEATTVVQLVLKLLLFSWAGLLEASNLMYFFR